jgi:hypothetical protein
VRHNGPSGPLARGGGVLYGVHGGLELASSRSARNPRCGTAPGWQRTCEAARSDVRFEVQPHMTQQEYRAEAYRMGHHFARRQLRAGKDPDSVRLAMEGAQEHLKARKAFPAGLGEMMRLGVEDALAAKPMDRRYITPGAARGGAGRRFLEDSARRGLGLLLGISRIKSVVTGLVPLTKLRPSFTGKHPPPPRRHRAR